MSVLAQAALFDVECFDRLSRARAAGDARLHFTGKIEQLAGRPAGLDHVPKQLNALGCGYPQRGERRGDMQTERRVIDGPTHTPQISDLIGAEARTERVRPSLERFGV